MAFERAGSMARGLLSAALLIGGAQATAQEPPPTLAYPAIETGAMLRNVNTPTPTAWRPDEDEQQRPLDLFIRYRDALALGQADAVETLAHDEFLASLAANRAAGTGIDDDWSRGQIALTRMTWYPAPAGQPHNLYVAFDLISGIDDGRFACGYVIISRIATSGADFRVLNSRITYVEATLVENRMPRADVLPQLECWLGETVGTALNR